MTVGGIDRVAIVGIDEFRAPIEVDAGAKAAESVHEILVLGHSAGVNSQGVEVKRRVLIFGGVQNGGVGAPLERVEQVPSATEACNGCGPGNRVIEDGNAALRRGAETHVGEGNSGCVRSCRRYLDVQREVVAEKGIGAKRVTDILGQTRQSKALDRSRAVDASI